MIAPKELLEGMSTKDTDLKDENGKLKPEYGFDDDGIYKRIELSPYQLKSAAQVNFACMGPFGGCIIGDKPGNDRIIQVLLSIYLNKDKSGRETLKTLIVVPKDGKSKEESPSTHHWMRVWPFVSFLLTSTILANC